MDRPDVRRAGCSPSPGCDPRRDPLSSFLLSSTLQVDISFWAQAKFGAIGPNFRLLFGTAAKPITAATPAAVELVGMGWRYGLHARSSIARGRVWQAEYMIMRDQALALACKYSRAKGLLAF